MAKKGFMDGYKRYDPSKEGYGSAREWRAEFRATMGLDEARTILQELTPEQVLDIPPRSSWSVVRAAYKKLAFACHPDRCAIHGLPKEEAERLFKQVQAAYVILEAQHQTKRP